MFQPIRQQQAVRQAGQRIVIGRPAQPFPRPITFGGVGEDRSEPTLVPREDGNFQVLVQSWKKQFEPPGLTGGDHLVEQLQIRCDHLAVNVSRQLAESVLFGPIQNAFELRIAFDQTVIDRDPGFVLDWIVQGHALGHAVEQRVQALFAPAQRLGGAQPFHDVAGHSQHADQAAAGVAHGGFGGFDQHPLAVWIAQPFLARQRFGRNGRFTVLRLKRGGGRPVDKILSGLADDLLFADAA